MIKAIETRYAGCRFRSRLEARWAVFFDHLGITWEYEPQGFGCTYRLTLDGNNDGFPYLPDFWFPELSLHGEVKGSLTHPELTRLLDAAASLSSNDGGGCGQDNGGHDLVVFGNIPRPRTSDDGRLPTRLHMHKGDLNASGWFGAPDGCQCGEIIAADYGGDPGIYCLPADEVAQWLTSGTHAYQWIDNGGFQLWADAYTAARSARFEHGEHG